MTSRFLRARSIGPLSIPLIFVILSGCSDAFNGGPLTYVESDRVVNDLRDKDKKDNLPLQKAVRDAMAGLFGPDPQHIKVPAGMGLPGGGYRLARYIDRGSGDFKTFQPISVKRMVDGQPLEEPQAGGFALYRQHCLHCHGVSGAGDGPTSAFLFPRPRDYRRGVFKFTSTPTGVKPTRADLRKTITNGLHGTSMPAFEALMTAAEIEQVLDYMTFLSARGETELSLVDDAASAGELPADSAADDAKSVFNKWKQAESQVMNPPVPQTPTSPESVERGRALFLGVGTGLNKQGNKKVDCTSCHGPGALGNGPSFVSQDVFNDVVFGGKLNTTFKLNAGQIKILDVLSKLEGKPEGSASAHEASEATKSVGRSGLLDALKLELALTGKESADDLRTKTGYDAALLGPAESYEAIVDGLVKDLEDKALVSTGSGLFGGGGYHAAIDGKTAELWNNSLDEWGMPLRPNNLNRGIYKGGRRPIDIYWRIAKGINGAKMPAHYPAIEPTEIWDLVNFVLALPFQPKLLEGATLSTAPPATPAVATR